MAKYHFKVNPYGQFIYCKRRPGARTFLKAMSAKYEVVLFTCGRHTSTDLILDQLDPNNKFFSYQLYHQDCNIIRNEAVKDLKALGRPLSRIITIDNSNAAYTYNIKNLLPVSPWYGNTDDRELETIHNSIDMLEGHLDVTKVLNHMHDKRSSIQLNSV